MPYQAGPTLAALGQADKLSTMESPLEAARKRRRERLEDIRAERQLQVNEKAQELEEKKHQAEEAAAAAKIAARKKAIDTLPPKPQPGSTPEQMAGWYVTASEHMARKGFLEAAEEFRNAGSEAYNQQVTGPVEIEETRAGIESTRIGTEETRRELDAGMPEELAEKTEAEAYATRALGDLRKVQTEAGGFPPSAASKPRTTEQLLKEDAAIVNTFEGIWANEIPDLEYDEDGAMTTPVSIDNKEYLRDMYSMDVKDHGPDKARNLLRNNLSYVETGENIMDFQEHKAYLIPKAWEQMYQERFQATYNRPPTKEEKVAAWEQTLSAWKNERMTY